MPLIAPVGKTPSSIWFDIFPGSTTLWIQHPASPPWQPGITAWAWMPKGVGPKPFQYALLGLVYAGPIPTCTAFEIIWDNWKVVSRPGGTELWSMLTLPAGSVSGYICVVANSNHDHEHLPSAFTEALPMTPPFDTDILPKVHFP